MRKLLCLLALLTFLPPGARAQFVHTREKQILGPDNKVLHLKGINLGNWMNPEGYMFHFDGGPQSAREIQDYVQEMIGPTRAASFWHTWREQYITREDIHFIRESGFNSVRVPINYKLFAGEDAEGWRLLDNVVAWSRAEGIYVVIDLHAADGGQTGANIDDSYGWPWLFLDSGAQADTIALWQKIASRYKNEPAVLGYDLLNEPLPAYTAGDTLKPLLEPLYLRIVAAIRERDAKHIVILEAAHWDTDFSSFGKPFDSNVVYEFHTYWAPPVEATVRPYLDFRDKWNVPLWMGESGENKDEWIATFRALMDKLDIGWCFWPYKKMDATSSPVTFARPAGWDAVVTYAKGNRNLSNIEKRQRTRPAQDVVDRAFAGLLENLRYSAEKRNEEYLRALFPGQ